MQVLQRLATQPGEPSPAIQRTVLAACQSIATASSRGGQEHIIPDLLDSLQQVGPGMAPCCCAARSVLQAYTALHMLYRLRFKGIAQPSLGCCRALTAVLSCKQWNMA